MNNNKKISTLVVAHNEEKNLEECLKRLKYSDELIVVLDRTNDRSKVISEMYGATVYEGSWVIEADRRNYGMQKCKGDWILEIDADERVPEELFKEIRSEINNSKPGYYLIPFDNFIGKRRIRYGWGASWGVSAAPRLSFKGCKVWNNSQRIHPSLKLKGKKGILKNRIYHYVDNSINDMFDRLKNYTDKKAKDIISNNERVPPFLIILRKSVTRFIKCYFSRKGYKEGKWGFLIALMASLYILVSYLKASIEKK